jgi:hypothetical protein
MTVRYHVHVKFIILVLALFCYSLLMLATMWWIRCPEASRNLFMTKTVCQRKDATSALLTCTHQGQGKAIACAIETAYMRRVYLQYCRHPGPSSSLGHPYPWGLGIEHSLSTPARDRQDLPWRNMRWVYAMALTLMISGDIQPCKGWEQAKASSLHTPECCDRLQYLCYIQIETSGNLFCPYTWGFGTGHCLSHEDTRNPIMASTPA